MGLFTSIKQIMEDLKLWLFQNKLKFLALLLIFVIAFVFGIVLFANNDGWWYVSRCKQINLLVYGNFFSVLFNVVFQLCVVLLVLISSQIHKYLQLIRYFALFIGGIYVGSNIACLFATIGFCVTIYAILYVALFGAILIIVCLDTCHPTEYCKRLTEIVNDCKKQICLISILFFVKFLALFLILRPFSGVF
jgi:hypothetical protein